MRSRLCLLLTALLAGAVLWGCAAPNAPRTPPPPATKAEIEKEMQYLEKHFFTDACMAGLRRSAPELTPSTDHRGKAIYAVEFAQMTDGNSYRLHVTERDRQAYLYTSVGGGWYTVRGPLPLWQCLQDTLQ
jgi:hypothetical protein